MLQSAPRFGSNRNPNDNHGASIFFRSQISTAQEERQGESFKRLEGPQLRYLNFHVRACLFFRLCGYCSWFGFYQFVLKFFKLSVSNFEALWVSKTLNLKGSLAIGSGCFEASDLGIPKLQFLLRIVQHSRNSSGIEFHTVPRAIAHSTKTSATKL